jgi:hypothetical protein
VQTVGSAKGPASLEIGIPLTIKPVSYPAVYLYSYRMLFSLSPPPASLNGKQVGRYISAFTTANSSNGVLL